LIQLHRVETGLLDFDDFSRLCHSPRFKSNRHGWLNISISFIKVIYCILQDGCAITFKKFFLAQSLFI